jgi:thioredoxin reductase (NADPH)
MLDVIVIGGGPVGLACAIEARRARLEACIIEKGALVNSIVGYPTNMEFFSTPELIEIGGYPFPVHSYKPTREEAIEYYRSVTARESLDIRLYERVLDVNGTRGDFTVITSKDAYPTRNVILATGFFDEPNLLNVPGEELPKVTHYYREPYQYMRQKVLIIGAKNSAAKAALDCYRHGAEVSLAVRSAALSDKIKYWIKPDLENRIAEGSIRAYFNTTVEGIRESTVTLRTADEVVDIPNDWVLAMTGYHPDYRFLESFDLAFSEDACRAPLVDGVTFQSSRPGIYLAGTVCGGYCTSRWFIENGRFHASQIAKHIAGERAEPIPFEAIHWKTEE